jgi:hypothetical protein
MHHEGVAIHGHWSTAKPVQVTMYPSANGSELPFPEVLLQKQNAGSVPTRSRRGEGVSAWVRWGREVVSVPSHMYLSQRGVAKTYFLEAGPTRCERCMNM